MQGRIETSWHTVAALVGERVMPVAVHREEVSDHRARTSCSRSTALLGRVLLHELDAALGPGRVLAHDHLAHALRICLDLEPLASCGKKHNGHRWIVQGLVNCHRIS